MDKEKAKDEAVAKYQSEFIISPLHGTKAFEEGFDAGYDARESGWVAIKSEDDLPKEDCWFWTTGGDGITRRLYHDGRGGWFDSPTMQLAENRRKVIAWMPLPQPYEEKV